MSDLPMVGGRRLEISLVVFERACLMRLKEIQEQGFPDTALISVLCNAVRLARQYADMVAGLQDTGSLSVDEFKTAVEMTLRSAGGLK